MSTPLSYEKKPTDQTLGVEGSSTYVLRGRTVYRVEHSYMREHCSAAAWEGNSAAKRITERLERAERERELVAAVAAVESKRGPGSYKARYEAKRRGER